MTSVADVLALDAVLDEMTPMGRASVERAMKDRFSDPGAVAHAYERGYHDGASDAKEAAERKAREEAARKEPPKPDEQKPA